METYSAWATALRQACGERKRSALRIEGSASSSSESEPDPLWPTTTTRATEGEGGPSGRDGSGSPHLCSVAADFPTPSATEYGSSQNGINGKGGENERPSAGTPSLSTAARHGALPGGTRGALNPVFVEALMGWPLGWSDPEAPAGRSVPFPPPPRDTDGWARYLAENPEAIPAVPSDAVERRVDRLRACGNGVVPAQAAAAFGELFGALGFAASTDQGSESRTQSPRTRGWRNAWRTAQVTRGQE